jgi:hypothetical protein
MTLRACITMLTALLIVSPVLAAPAEDEDTQSPVDEVAIEIPTDLEHDEATAEPTSDTGRRDPFVPPSTIKPPGNRWEELRLTSLVRTPSGVLATFEGGPRNEAVFVRVGDRLANATVSSIDYAGARVTLLVEDPATPRGFREVSTTLAP